MDDKDMETLIRAQLENQYGVNHMSANSIRWLKTFLIVSLMANVSAAIALYHAYAAITRMTS